MNRQHRFSDGQVLVHPCTVISAGRNPQTNTIQVAYAPITHSGSDDDPDSMEVPTELKDEAGLDHDPRGQWVKIREIEVDDWPGRIRRRTNVSNGTEVYGKLPKDFVQVVKDYASSRKKS